MPSAVRFGFWADSSRRLRLLQVGGVGRVLFRYEQPGDVGSVAGLVTRRFNLKLEQCIGCVYLLILVEPSDSPSS